MTRTEIIRSQVTAHPEMTSGELATHLNTETTQQTRRVSMSELHEWANIKRLARRFYDEHGVITHKPLYDELMQLLQGKQDSVNVNSAEAGVTGLITDLVTAGLLTMEEVGELQALGMETVTLAQSLGIGGIAWQEIDAVKEVM